VPLISDNYSYPSTTIKITGSVLDPVGYLDFPYVKEIRMVEDNQVRILMKLVNQEKLLKTAAAKAGMSEKTARKYRRSGKLPSQCKVVHDWRTRPDFGIHCQVRLFSSVGNNGSKCSSDPR
jgi:hypothetical protein